MILYPCLQELPQAIYATQVHRTRYDFHVFHSLCILVTLCLRLTEVLDRRDSQRVYDLSEEEAITHSDIAERPAIVFPEGTPYSTRYYGD